MKSLTIAFSAAALFALAASPALSASRHHARHHYAPYTYGYDGRPFHSGGVNSPAPIYRQGRYLGTDPDPNVRFEIARDPYFGRK